MGGFIRMHNQKLLEGATSFNKTVWKMIGKKATTVEERRAIHLNLNDAVVCAFYITL